MATLDIALLKSFVAVARAGSIRAAADRVGRTQSALSLQMKKLEQIAGDRLLHRTGSGVTLTVAGERLIAGAERILSAHDDTLAMMRPVGLRGALSFGCPEDYLAAFFPDLLRRYGQANPDVEIEIVCAPTVELRPMLARRRIDLALVSVPGATADTAILRHEPLVWIGGADSAELLARPQLPLALAGAETMDHRLARAVLDDAGRPYRVTHASNGLAGLLAIARSGLAVSVVTAAAVPSDLGVIATGLPALPRIGMTILCASPRPAAVVRAFCAHVETALRRDAPPCTGPIPES